MEEEGLPSPPLDEALKCGQCNIIGQCNSHINECNSFNYMEYNNKCPICKLKLYYKST